MVADAAGEREHTDLGVGELTNARRGTAAIIIIALLAAACAAPTGAQALDVVDGFSVQAGQFYTSADGLAQRINPCRDGEENVGSTVDGVRAYGLRVVYNLENDGDPTEAIIGTPLYPGTFKGFAHGNCRSGGETVRRRAEFTIRVLGPRPVYISAEAQRANLDHHHYDPLERAAATALPPLQATVEGLAKAVAAHKAALARIIAADEAAGEATPTSTPTPTPTPTEQ